MRTYTPQLKVLLDRRDKGNCHTIYTHASQGTAPSRPQMRILPISRGGGWSLLVSALLLCSASAGFIDMDTPLEKRTTISIVDGTEYQLVMSDEFNTPNRTFKDGHDGVWTALDKSDDDSSAAGGGSQQFYNSSMVTTVNGSLKIGTKVGATKWTRYDHVKKEWKNEKKTFLSGMVQSWEKFCFTGGIVEVEVIFPGDPFIGGLWPAVWMLGNLGRATYESSTNNIWPWSFDKCDRDLQPAQALSACNKQNHYGMNPYQGRGATEIDIIETCSGDSGGPLPSTEPPVALPYADFTLQVAPGIPENRPQSGHQPLRENLVAGHTEFLAQTWYEGLKLEGNTTINPFFYGTYMAKTKPGEPVTRTEKQAFQADAVGVMHQLTAAHFNRKHTFRVEWQPGRGGRLDWYAQSHKVNETFHMEGDGKGKDWVHAFSLKDASLHDLMGSQIPNEPTYLIMNTAISSTWGFPYDTPDWCQKCYDCDDPKCACAFAPGFCKMLKKTDVAMYIDSIRVYQSNNSDAHVGNNHSLGCDPPEYPTKEYIMGHEYRYMRNPPFVYADKKPLRPIQRGGGACNSDVDCGGHLNNENLTQVFLGEHNNSNTTDRKKERRDPMEVLIGHHYFNKTKPAGRGQCVEKLQMKAMFSSATGVLSDHVCRCNPGYTGPHCLAQVHTDDSPSAHKLRSLDSPFDRIESFQVTPSMMFFCLVLVPFFLAVMITQVCFEKKKRNGGGAPPGVSPKINRPQFRVDASDLLITGTSV